MVFFIFTVRYRGVDSLVVHASEVSCQDRVPSLPHKPTPTAARYIQPPPAQDTMRDLVTVFCLIHQQRTSSAFAVQIPRKEPVSVLKEHIVRKNRGHFKGIDPRQLRLWHINIRVGDERHPPTGPYNELNPTWKLGKIFPADPPEERIHIYIKALQPNAECTCTLHFITTVQFLMLTPSSQ